MSFIEVRAKNREGLRYLINIEHIVFITNLSASGGARIVTSSRDYEIVTDRSYDEMYNIIRGKER